MPEDIKKEIENWATSNNIKIDMEQINNASLEDRFEFNQPLASIVVALLTDNDLWVTP